MNAAGYSDLVVKWAVKVQRLLQTSDPQGVSKDPGLESLRFSFEFHIDKMIHLQKLGISVPAVPSDLEAVLSGIGNAFSEGAGSAASAAPWIAVAALVALGVLLLWRRP